MTGMVLSQALPRPPMTSSASLVHTGWREALSHLNAVLPLAARQVALAAPLRELHRHVLASFAQTGRCPRSPTLAARVAPALLEPALRELASLDLLVLDDAGELAGAYPYTLEQTVHRVTLDGLELHAMCAVDALAIAPMTGRTAVIRSCCHQCGAPIVLTQDDEAVAPAPLRDEIRIGIAWRDTDGCAARSLCREMVFFCGTSHAAAWQAGRADHDVLQTADAVALAKAFFMPLIRLETGDTAEPQST